MVVNRSRVEEDSTVGVEAVEACALKEDLAVGNNGQLADTVADF